VWPKADGTRKIRAMNTLSKIRSFLLLAIAFLAFSGAASGQPAAPGMGGDAQPQPSSRQPAAVPSPSVQASWQSDPVLVQLNSFYEKTTDFKADFRQVVNTKSPKRTFKRSGTVFFKRPGLMRWDYKVPEAVYYVSDGTILWAYDSEDRSAVKMNVKDSDLYSSLGFLSGTSRLADSFLARVGASDVEGFASVSLVPVDGSDAGNYQSLVLKVNRATGEVVETEITDPMGNKSRIRFQAMTYAPVPASAFEFKVPSGVSVQDLTKPAPASGAPTRR